MCIMSIIGGKMNILLLFIILLNATNTFLIKKFQMVFKFSARSFLWYNFINASVLAMIPLTTYNIVMPALSMMATLCVSLIIFKENIKFRQIVALVLMITASVLCNINK